MTTVDDDDLRARARRLLEQYPPVHHRARHLPPRAVRRRAGLAPLPAGLRRPRRVDRAAADRRRPPEGRGRAAEWSDHEPDRHRPVRGDRAGFRQRGAEAPLPPGAVHRRGAVVPALQRARERFRPRVTRDAGRARRRRVGRRRPEGVDERRPPRPPRVAAGPHRPGRREARRPHRVRHRPARARGRGAAAASDERRRRVQRGVPQWRPDPRHRAPGRRRCGLGRRAPDPRARALQHAPHPRPRRGSHRARR